jgi:hypothetical protein
MNQRSLFTRDEQPETADPRPAPFSPEWTRRVWELRQTHPEMTDDEWLSGFWGPDITKRWREGQTFWSEMRGLKARNA